MVGAMDTNELLLTERDIHLQDIIARGGFSSVHRAKLNLKKSGEIKTVAVKKVTLYAPAPCFLYMCFPCMKRSTSHLVSSPNKSMSVQMRTQLVKQGKMTVEDALQEAKWLRLMKDESFFLEFHGSFVGGRGKKFFIVTELGVTSLRRLLISSSLLDKGTSSNKFPLSVTWHLILPVFEAVYHMHQKGIIHRDIKEENILLTRSGVPKLCDFGLAATFKPESLPLKVETGRQVGTNWYMAPEIVCQTKYNEGVDGWSIAMTMLSMIRGGNPFEMESDEVITLWDPNVVNFYKMTFFDLEAAEKGSGQPAFYELARLDTYAMDTEQHGTLRSTINRGKKQWKLMKDFLRTVLVIRYNDRPTPSEIMQGDDSKHIHDYLGLWREYLQTGGIREDVVRETDEYGKYRKQFNKVTKFIQRMLEEYERTN